MRTEDEVLIEILEDLTEELKKLRKALRLGVITYVVFWSTIIALIHLIMIPAIKGG